MEVLTTPEVGTTCPALTNENYDYHLSDDCKPFCICGLNNQPCKGRTIQDPEDQSNQFFSRAKCIISQNGLKSCPVYGVSNKTFKRIIKDKLKQALDEKMNSVDSYKK